MQLAVLILLLALSNPHLDENAHLDKNPYELAYQQAIDKKVPLVVVFTGDDCYYCRLYEPILEAETKNVVLFKTTIDQYPELAAHLKVTSVPTTAVCSPGKENLEILRGAVSAQKLRDAIRRKR